MHAVQLRDLDSSAPRIRWELAGACVVFVARQGHACNNRHTRLDGLAKPSQQPSPASVRSRVAAGDQAVKYAVQLSCLAAPDRRQFECGVAQFSIRGVWSRTRVHGPLARH